MAIKIAKLFNGLRESIGESVAYQYLVTGAEPSSEGDDTNLRQQIVDLIPRMENNIKLSGLSIDSQINDTTWFVTATYATDNKSFPNNSSMSFDTSGTQVHKTNDIKLLYQVVKNGNQLVVDPADNGKSKPIGFNGEDVEGVDIGVGGFAFTETHPIPDTVITDEYRKKLRDLSWTVNNAPFRGYAAGEVLFKGVSGSKNGTEKWILTFNFESIPNETNIEIDNSVIPLKKGWEYMAIRYGKKLSDDLTRLVVTILQIDVHQVYKETDFSELGIGIETWEEITQSNVQDAEFILFPFGN